MSYSISQDPDTNLTMKIFQINSELQRLKMLFILNFKFNEHENAMYRMTKS